jgi:hypothetical protein
VSGVTLERWVAVGMMVFCAAMAGWCGRIAWQDWAGR